MYEQFIDDLAKIKKDDILRFDDGHKSQLHALEIAKMHGIRVIVGITTDFIGRPGYMTWEDVKAISEDHEIANHSRMHEHLNEYDRNELMEELGGANIAIHKNTGIWPTTYLPTYNFRTRLVDDVCVSLNMQVLDPVVIMYNTTVL